MFGIQNYVTSLTKTLRSKGSNSNPSFHLFPLLPPELRREIFQHAIPHRIIEVSICQRFGEWVCHTAKSNEVDYRERCALFSVNVESRELCMEQFVEFANTYIHPSFDILYLQWHHRIVARRTLHSNPSFTALEAKSLEKFKNVVITGASNPAFDTRFGAIIDCLRRLGSPKEITLGFDGPKLSGFLTDIKGFSSATGDQVILLNWGAADEDAKAPSSEIQEDPALAPRANLFQQEVISAMSEAAEVTHDFEIPIVNARPLYIYAGP